MKKIFQLLSILWISSLPAHSLVGQSLEHFALHDILTSEFIDSESFPEEIYVLHFWSSWCHSCLKDHDAVVELARHYPVVSIVVSDHKEKIQECLEEKTNPYLFILDDYNSKIALDMQIPFAPYTLIIDGHGKILKEHAGLLKNLDALIGITSRS